jgi:hypothetical protein
MSAVDIETWLVLAVLIAPRSAPDAPDERNTLRLIAHSGLDLAGGEPTWKGTFGVLARRNVHRRHAAARRQLHQRLSDVAVAVVPLYHVDDERPRSLRRPLFSQGAYAVRDVDSKRRVIARR